MHAKTSELPRHSRPGILAANQPLVVPMILRISDLKLRGIVVLVVSKTKGVTLVFKNDPLESIRISSTFDSVSILRDFLQRQIETQLRNMLQEDLPVMIHNLSLRFIQSEEEKKKKKEQEEKLLQLEQQLSRSNSIYSEPVHHHHHLGRADSFHLQPSTPMTAPMRLRSWTNSSDFSSLPELLDDSSSSSPLSPISQPSLLSTPIVGSFDLGETYYNNYNNDNNYMTASPTSTVFGSSYMEANFKKNDSMIQSLEQRLESLNIDSENDSENDYFRCRSVPITVANLFSHNRSMNQLGINYHPMRNVLYQGQQLQQQQFNQQQDLVSENGLSTITTPYVSMSDVYAEDADAPWYAVEGPELFTTTVPALPLNTVIDEKNTFINTTENRMAKKLSHLMAINYTLSPSTETISNFTFRSLPYVKKSTSTSTRHKKVPKRRVTRLNMTIPRL